MRNILVLQHVAHEPLGTLNPLLKIHGLRIRYVNYERDPHAKIDVTKYNGLVILGGPMGVYEAHKYPHITEELKIIEAALKKNIPILGICLGAQMLATVLSAQVRPHHEKELGWHPVHLTSKGQNDPLFSHFLENETIFQMHGDTFDIPQTTDHLAFSQLCEGQAFRYGTKAYGLQFHLEVDAQMIKRLMKNPIVLNDFKMAGGKTSPEQVLEETKKHIERSLQLSHKTFTKFIELFALPEKKIVLGSGHEKSRR